MSNSNEYVFNEGTNSAQLENDPVQHNQVATPNHSASGSFRIENNFSGIEPDEGIDFLQLFRALTNHLSWIGLITSILVAIGIVYALSVEPRFRSTTKVYVEGAGAAQSSLSGDDLFESALPDDKVLESEIEVIRSNIIVSKVIDKLALNEDPEFNPELRKPTFIQRIKRTILGFFNQFRNIDPGYFADKNEAAAIVTSVTDKLSVNVLNSTYIIEISAEASSAQRAAEIAQTFAAIYMQDRLDQKTETSDLAIDYLNRKVPELRADLGRIEREITAFETEGGVLTAEALAASNGELARRNERLVKLQEKYEIASGVTNEFSGRIINELSAQSVLTALAPDLAQSVSGQRAISFATDELRSTERWLNERYQIEKTELETTKSSLRARIATQSQRKAEFERMQQEAGVASEIYESFLVNLKEVSQKAAVPERDVRIIANAERPAAPFAPKRNIIVLMFTAIGLLLGALFAFAKEFLYSPFRNSNDFEKLMNVPAFASTPAVKGSKISIAKPPGRDIKARQHLIDSIQDLRSMIFIGDRISGGRVISVTSSVPTEGKTTTAVLLAQSCAGAGEKTLLIDCDLLRFEISRKFAKEFNTELPMGLAQILDGTQVLTSGFEKLSAHSELNQELVRRFDGHGNLDFLLAGKDSDRSSKLLASGRFSRLIEDLRSVYDTIVIDCPPMIVGSDPIVVADLADIALYLVRADRTRRGVVRRHFGMMQARVGSKARIVLSHEKLRGGYGYGYGYGYAYGKYRYRDNYRRKGRA